MQHTSLTPVEELKSFVYKMLLYVNIYGTYKLLNTVRVFGPSCILSFLRKCSLAASPAVMQLGTLKNRTIYFGPCHFIRSREVPENCKISGDKPCIVLS